MNKEASSGRKQVYSHRICKCISRLLILVMVAVAAPLANAPFRFVPEGIITLVPHP
jgi:hypothetical protein